MNTYELTRCPGCGVGRWSTSEPEGAHGGNALSKMLTDLGAQRALPWALRARVFADAVERDGETVNLPNDLAWRALRGVQATFGVAKVGMVVLGLAQVGTTRFAST